ncbi:unnamed protein product [Toxocara canis]|uniref:Uncharacterized protein n=1 Tax=Toxocara canis TaxID=6265 RepID=A0A183UMA8_TOXCA|nr:unnamed protein product [Toxocara canis]
MTDEVVEAATLCLVAQAEEVESTGDASEEQLERAVLEEFGRCLGQVIENASKTTAVMHLVAALPPACCGFGNLGNDQRPRFFFGNDKQRFRLGIPVSFEI